MIEAAEDVPASVGRVAAFLPDYEEVSGAPRPPPEGHETGSRDPAARSAPRGVASGFNRRMRRSGIPGSVRFSDQTMTYPERRAKPPRRHTAAGLPSEGTLKGFARGGRPEEKRCARIVVSASVHVTRNWPVGLSPAPNFLDSHAGWRDCCRSMTYLQILVRKHQERSILVRLRSSPEDGDGITSLRHRAAKRTKT